MRIYLLAMFCVNAQVYSARVLTLDSKEQVIDSPMYDENIILADSLNKNGNNIGDLMEIINEELFPNQQVEVQLEIDGSNYVPKQYLRRSETSVLPPSSSIITTPTHLETSTKSAVKDRPVYMSDLKKVFDDFEKKHTSVQVEKGIGKPTGENMSWFQIKIPRN
ncbi:unnamed protein product [Pieris macdunnoughi]|uniref:Uncharacterized protein n=1 Tax=Pieris macdunnoughi TaxID=345717 RepID=A0A821U2G0_9NEOP|nr:unnamed protein product [Pieris macdunnoughi]